MLAIVFVGTSCCRAGSIGLSKGQIVYVPAYSQVHVSDRRIPFNLAVTLVVRNTDRKHPIQVTSAAYHDSSGKMLREFVATATKVGPWASIDFFVKESDVSGGTAPSFVVEWRSEERVTPPVVEAVMIGASRQQGISFISPGRVLSESSE